MRILQHLALVGLLVIEGCALESFQSLSNVTRFGAARRSIEGVTPTLDIAESYMHAQVDEGSQKAGTPSILGACSVESPCADGSCCNGDGLCGYRPEHCRPVAPKICVSNCNAKAPCGEFSKDGKTSCPLNLCCSFLGTCGLSDLFCHPEAQGVLDAPCQQNCGIVDTPWCGANSGTASRRIAYYESWNSRRRACDKVLPPQINTNGLTHLVLAFATIDPKDFAVGTMDPDDVDIYQTFLALSSEVSKWISIGGWDFTDPGATQLTWSQMTSTKDNRQAFIDSLKQFLTKWSFIGVDISWEWPGAASRGGNQDDMHNLVSFITELRQALDPKFGLSVVLPAQYEYLKNFDLNALESQVDFFSILTYDLHGPWDSNVPGLGPQIRPHTGLGEIDTALKLLWSANINPSKINLGISNYGRGFTVSDKNCVKVGCQFNGPSKAGTCTNMSGVLSSCEIRRVIAANNLTPHMISSDFAVKQISWGDQWIGYDDKDTLAIKLELANIRCLGGTALWAIDYDICDGSNSPLPTASGIPAASSAPTASSISTASGAPTASGVPAASGASTASSIPTASGVPPAVSAIQPSIISGHLSGLLHTSISLPQSPLLHVSSELLTGTVPPSANTHAPSVSFGSRPILGEPSISSGLASVNSSATSSFNPAMPHSVQSTPIMASIVTALPMHASESSEAQSLSVSVVSTGIPSSLPALHSGAVTIGLSTRQSKSAKPSANPSMIATFSAAQSDQSRSDDPFSTFLPTDSRITNGFISFNPDSTLASGFSEAPRPISNVVSPSAIWSSEVMNTAAPMVLSSDSQALQLQTVSVTGSGTIVSSCSAFPCIALMTQQSLSTPQTVPFSAFTENLIVVTGGSTATTTGEVETVISGSITKFMMTFLTVQNCSTSTLVSIMNPSPVTISEMPSCEVLLQSPSGTLPQYPCIYPSETTLTVAANTHSIPWHGFATSTSVPGPNTFDPCVFESKTQLGIVPIVGLLQKCPPQCLLYDWCRPFCDADLLPTQMPSLCNKFDWCLLFWGRHTNQIGSPAPDDADPACVPNDCVKDCFFWRIATWALFKRPVCPCIPTFCNKPNQDKKCKLFGCGCGWMGLDFGPGCESEGFIFELPKFGFPCGLFGCNPCRFFGCPPNGVDDENGILGFGGYCLLEGGCDPCPPEICSGPACTIEGGCGPKPGPPPTEPADRPQTCEEKEKTRVTERFIWCTEGFAVSDLPSSIGGTSSSMISTLCVPLVEATMKVCPGAMAGYTTTTTKTATTTLSSSEAPACTRAPLTLDDDEGSNMDPDFFSSMISNVTSPGSEPSWPTPPRISRSTSSSEISSSTGLSSPSISTSSSSGISSATVSDQSLSTSESTSTSSASSSFSPLSSSTLSSDSSSSPSSDSSSISTGSSGSSTDSSTTTSTTSSESSTDSSTSTSTTSSDSSTESSTTTSTTSSESSTDSSTSTSITSSTVVAAPTSPAPGSMDRFGSWWIKFELWMVQKSSGENWTLYDPNGNQAGTGYSQGVNVNNMSDYIQSQNRPEQQSMPYGVKVIVTDPTNVDKVRVDFEMDKDVPSCPFVECKAGMMTEDKTEDNMFEVRSCQDQCENTKLRNADFWCNDLSDAMWLPDNGGWKRKFWCGWKGY